MNTLVGKNILLIVPKFHEYDIEIANELERHGASVKIIHENLESLSMFYRFVYVYLKRFKGKVQTKYYKNRLRDIGGGFDVVFVVRGMSLTQRSLELIKELNPQARFIMYQWDSTKRNPNAIKISVCFDKVYTFDPIDSKNYGWKYRPLFYVKERDEEKVQDICFIGALHTDRLKICSSLKKLVDQKDLTSTLYLFIKRLIYVRHILISKDKEKYQTEYKDMIHFRPLPLSEANQLFAKSRIIVDYADPEQNGLTMRTIEAVGNHCKIVTNNKFVKYEPFYNENNIALYNGTDINISDCFLGTDYQTVDHRIMEKYSIKAWVEEIFFDEEQ